MNFLEYLQNLLNGNQEEEYWLRGGYPQSKTLGMAPLVPDNTPVDPYSSIKKGNFSDHKDLLWALELEKRQRPHQKYMGYNSLIADTPGKKYNWKSDIPMEQYDPTSMDYLSMPLRFR